MISADTIAPYDRTALSKGVATAEASQTKLRSEEFLKTAEIDLKLNAHVKAVDNKKK